MPDGIRVLTLDIETAPNLAWVWGLWRQNIAISQLEQPSSVMLVGAKWLDAPKRETYLLRGEEMVHDVHGLLDQADAVIHYNGSQFDMPHLHREFVEIGLPPPSPYVNIDLLRTVRKKFRFPSNKLDYVTGRLLGKSKVKHDGFELWLRCMKDDPAAWAQMEKYCKGDVILTEALYHRLLPWIDNHPVIGLYDGSGNAVISCPNCASRRLQRRGMAYTRLGSYHRYQCQGCGKWSRGATRVGTTISR